MEGQEIAFLMHTHKAGISFHPDSEQNQMPKSWNAPILSVFVFPAAHINEFLFKTLSLSFPWDMNLASAHYQFPAGIVLWLTVVPHLLRAPYELQT